MHSASELERAYFEYKSFESAMGQAEERDGAPKRLRVEQASTAATLSPAPSQASAKGRGRGRGPRSGRHNNSSAPVSRGETHGLHELVREMSVLLIRHEDTMAAARSDNGFVLTLKTGSTGILPSLRTAQLQWKKRKEEDPASLTQPLRVILLQLTLDKLRTEVSRAKGEEERTKLRQAGQIDDQNRFVKQVWSHESGQLHPTTEGMLTFDEVENTLAQLIVNVAKPGVLHQFHAVQPLHEPTLPAVTFVLLLSGRAESHADAHAGLLSLCQNSSFNLVAGSLRQERLRRTPLADQIQTHARSLFAARP